VTDLEASPTELYSPRERFDELFTDDVFREGLRAASRLATAYVFSPDKIKFIPEAVEKVRSFPLDPDGRIKAHTEIISKTLPEDTVKAAIGLFRHPVIQQLIRSVGTRLATFLPNIEILARIYVSLRKRSDLTPGDRLKIQQEVVLRYQEGPYTEESAKTARNLALTYFTDHLVEFCSRQYSESLAAASGVLNDPESRMRRHEALKATGFSTIEEWGVRVGLSAQVLGNIKNRFMQAADEIQQESLAEDEEEDGDGKAADEET